MSHSEAPKLLALIEAVAQQSLVSAECQDLAEKTHAYLAAARASSTARAYASDWRDFVGWCAAVRLQALPASAQTVALYITQMARSRRVATIQRRLVAISQLHQEAGHATPTDDRLVRKTMSGVMRTHGVAPRRKARIRTNLLRDLVRHLPDTPEGSRDRALLLVGFSGALRRSELVALDRADITFEPGGVCLSVRVSDTDREQTGAIVGLPYGQHVEICPVSALRAWLGLLDDEHPAVFRRISRWGTPTRGRLSAQSVVACGQAPHRCTRTGSTRLCGP